MSVVVLIPAHNEEESIGRTITAILDQDRPADKVVVIPNGCTDRTADVARGFPVTVMELPRLAHRKSEALNRAWFEYAQDADIVVCLDADTELPPNALRDWEQQMVDAPGVGGISSKFTMLAPDLLSRIQKAEFATWTQTALDRGSTSVLAGTGCAIRGQALREVAALNGDDMKEEAWTRLAPNGRSRKASVTDARTATAASESTEKNGSHTDTSGHRRTALSPREWLSATSATTRRASILTTSKSARNATTYTTETSEADNGNPARPTASAAAPTVTLTTPAGESAEHVRLGGCAKAERDGHPSKSSGTSRVIANGSATTEKSSTARTGSDEPPSGPWSYESATEDFRLTTRIRQLGYRCIVSPTVRAYTDSMKTVSALFAQRLKWQTGTVQDLLAFGVNRLTLRDWCQQVACIFNVFAKALLVAFWVALIITAQVNFIWFWWLLPVLFVALDFVRSRSIPHRDRTDTTIALSFFPMEFFMWMRAAWTAAAWWKVLTRSSTDLWGAQYRAEGAPAHV